jgi:hypothetical protein
VWRPDDTHHGICFPDEECQGIILPDAECQGIYVYQTQRRSVKAFAFVVLPIPSCETGVMGITEVTEISNKSGNSRIQEHERLGRAVTAGAQLF